MSYLKILLFIFILKTNILANELVKIKSFEASFTQTITNPSGNKVFYNGLLHIKEPNRIKWEYTTPIEKFVYIKKHTVTILEPELEQAIITKLENEINILSLLNNAKKISQTKYISNFNNINYTLTMNNNKLQDISYKDEIENDVIITFTNVQQNHKIDSKIFKFFIPLEFDIIKK